VWAHHMFAVGNDSGRQLVFPLCPRCSVGVPTGIKISSNWPRHNLWAGKLRFKVPMLFSLGFLFQFLIAGLTGIMLGVAPFDWQVTDTYFVVAHFTMY